MCNTKIYITKIPKEKSKERKERKSTEEIMAESLKFKEKHWSVFPKAWWTPNRIKTNAERQRKWENLKSNKRNITHHVWGNAKRLTADFSWQTMQHSNQWDDIFKMLQDSQGISWLSNA